MSSASELSQVAYLDSAPNGTLLLIAVADEAGLNDWVDVCVRLPYPWIFSAIHRLQALGSTQIGNYCYTDQWAMVAIKGQGVALSESLGRTTNQANAVAQATVQLP